jgi:hypothetical protein
MTVPDIVWESAFRDETDILWWRRNSRRHPGAALLLFIATGVVKTLFDSCNSSSHNGCPTEKTKNI